jgi:nitrite reductase/ring-hydroxylating ferredoxin subunit
MVEAIRIEKATLPAEGHGVRVMANGAPVAVFRVGGRLYALDARCSHVGGPLDKGTLAGTQVTCPWHHSVFDLASGAVVQGPAVNPVKAYRVQVEGDALVLEHD